MAMHRPSQMRRGSKNDTEKEEDEETENNGYIQVFVKPLEQCNYSFLLSWLGISKANFTAQQLLIVYGFGVILSSVFLYQLLKCDVGYMFQRLCALLVPMFSILCAFYWLSLYFRRTWSNISVYILFSSCYLGETFAQVCLRNWSGSGTGSSDVNTGESASGQVSQPIVIVTVLLSVSVASVFSSLETVHSAVVILLVSFTRFLSCSSLLDIPHATRPYVAYTCAFVGILVSKYMEAVMKPSVQNILTQDGKLPVIKRRRSSSSSAHGFSAHRSTRRTSLPALIQKNQSASAGYESAIIGEAHGLISDMLADSNLPPHIVSGLRAVSNLLKPPESHASIHKPRVSPLVSLTESSSYGSDSEESPYTGERPSSLPKRLRRSLPPSLIRRMSTSTWTTTTSATGMPTLEPEPCRIRSASFRHSREGTPGSSPNGSRSNSPSPISNTTVVLTIPKSRSFSLAATPSSQSHQRRYSRKSVGNTSDIGFSPVKLDSKTVRPMAPPEFEQGEDREAVSKPLTKRLHITSDYESSDSPSSSDHSDNIATSEDLVGSPPRKETVVHVNDKDDGDQGIEDKDETDGSISDNKLLFDISDVEEHPLLQISKLNEWDYPIFQLSDNLKDFILSKVAYKLFTEVGLFETFRIPIAEFINYFHALELGYRDKPYHNRIHATDVIHGVYFLTTQPIPGFMQSNSTEGMSRHGSSSESENETHERSTFAHRPSFAADDSYGIMGGNFPALELMALYTAAAMHDYDHPGRTNAFLVATHATQAILYNDRSVLENHHAAAAWRVLLTNPKNNFLRGLDNVEFKRFRFLVIEAIIATDLKRHFEILAEFNAKVNCEEAPGIDWTQETDRMLVMQMVIKIADINGPGKARDLHFEWTRRIAEEFYEQGDEEAERGMPISPYMDRKCPQLAKLQETFINHLVAPLCNAMVTGGLLPGTWVEEESDGEISGFSDTERGDLDNKDTEDECDSESGTVVVKTPKVTRKVNCLLTKNMKDNYELWIQRIKDEEQHKSSENESAQSILKLMERGFHTKRDVVSDKSEMEPIKEESESPPPSAKVVSAKSSSSLETTSDAGQSSDKPGHRRDEP
ncbi:cGMP-inhibited 3',5'-cyclic phosphodiesterase 3A isoform X3 [Patella vulgata]|uniref:cGMP-inhibited 3',5'-cyclic phosphodiesterase 3A isoform X3 n=1 Tax=Patella vulgata TaxID=6465 RepID=UPI0024A9BA0E|nr:cGMP-inhibited 3',5'-cyclic phosphodiesterase 3A isoform X3 [Patella vulgata]